MLEVKQNNRSEQQEIFKFIRLRASIKERINKDKAPGQCYDGFICQLVDLWEKAKESKQDYILNTSKGGDA